eukprot:CAMPEP_0113879666 /NCGR_PEP_ID=MMETSP0780_2-20120614/7360_1 /TAXON_ID=652834 /ORGANISM="Palpitomonas bilix" /LENGTH=499 /DNA_ID=CAMNT_0000866263 /DNA_START=122 /DNA_END=1621 /DNA_ORIENTATION=- /assembly_acc=CAM_ASM_000599
MADQLKTTAALGSKKAEVMRKKAYANADQFKSKVVELVGLGEEAIVKAVNAVKEYLRFQTLGERLEVIELCCLMTSAKAKLILEADNPPADLQESIASLAYAGGRYPVDELGPIKAVLMKKFPTFVKACEQNEFALVHDKLVGDMESMMGDRKLLFTTLVTLAEGQVPDLDATNLMVQYARQVHKRESASLNAMTQALSQAELKKRGETRQTIGVLTVQLGKEWKEMVCRVRNGVFLVNSKEHSEIVLPLLAISLGSARAKKVTEAEVGRPSCFQLSHASLPHGMLVCGAVSDEKCGKWIEVLNEEGDRITLHEELLENSPDSLPAELELDDPSMFVKSLEGMTMGGVEWGSVLGKEWARRLLVLRSGFLFTYSPEAMKKGKKRDPSKAGFDAKPSEVLPLSNCRIKKMTTGHQLSVHALPPAKLVEKLGGQKGAPLFYIELAYGGGFELSPDGKQIPKKMQACTLMFVEEEERDMFADAVEEQANFRLLAEYEGEKGE